MSELAPAARKISAAVNIGVCLQQIALNHANALAPSGLERLAKLPPSSPEEGHAVRDFRIISDMQRVFGARYVREPEPGKGGAIIALFGHQGREVQSSLKTEDAATGLLK